MKILATYNIKGGVGKTSAAVNLAFLAAQDGYRTLLWDLDPQGAASFYFRIKPKVKGGAEGLVRRKTALDDAVKATDFDGLDLIPADFSFRNFDLAVSDTKKPTKQLLRLMSPVTREYDLLFIDSAVGTLAPDIDLFAEVVRIYGYFAERHADQIARDVGFDPRLLPIDLSGFKRSVGLDDDTEAVTHRELRRRREVVQERVEKAGGVRRA